MYDATIKENRQLTRLEVKRLKEAQEILTRLAALTYLRGDMEDDVISALSGLKKLLKDYSPEEAEE